MVSLKLGNMSKFIDKGDYFMRINNFLKRLILMILIVLFIPFSAYGADDVKAHKFNSEKDKFKPKDTQKIVDEGFVYLQTEGLFSTTYKRTIDSTEYIYYGKLKKDMPNGKGILLDKSKKVIYLYIGEFKKGKKEGFGTVYIVDPIDPTGAQTIKDNSIVITMRKAYEGYFKANEFSGKGNRYELADIKKLNLTSSSLSEVVKFPDNMVTYTGSEKTVSFYDISDFYSNIRILTGTFKKDKINGEGKYYSNNVLRYEGKFKSGDYHGKGKLYYSDGTLKYKGNFKNGNYDGSGTLYNEDGSVKHKGKWKNGDVK